MPNHLIDDDYILTEGAAWFGVKGFAIRIHSTDEGVVVDVFDNMAMKTEPFVDPITTTCAFDTDCEKQQNETIPG